MLYREIFRFLGRYLFTFAPLLCIPLGISLYMQDGGALAFAITLLICGLAAAFFLFCGKKASGNFQRRESILIVALIWLLTPFIAALPFYLSHTLEKPLDAYFEAMSALTTTGSTVFHPKAYDPVTLQEIALHTPHTAHAFYGTIAPLCDPANGQILKWGVEAVAPSLLFWRSFLQWIGGMGIVVLFITILPALAMGGRLLYEAEVPGPTKEAMTPRIKETAGMLWKIYLGLTLLQIGLLLLTNRTILFFDALNLSLSTISTGGFTIRNDGIAAYHSLGTDWIVVIFMILGSLNFTLYFHCLRGKVYRIYEPEFLTYLGTLLFNSLLLGLLLWGAPKALTAAQEGIYTLSEALRYGTFQAVSAQSSTGFTFANYDLWPASCQLLLITLMFLGGMSGSTAGGIKIIRHLVLFRVVKHKIESIFRPNAVRCLKIGARDISDKMAITALIFFAILIAFSALGTFLLALDGIDLHTAMGLISAMINNGGLSFHAAGPTESCAFLPPLSKTVSILWMALGRLEFFILLVLLVPAYWRGK